MLSGKLGKGLLLILPLFFINLPLYQNSHCLVENRITLIRRIESRPDLRPDFIDIQQATLLWFLAMLNLELLDAPAPHNVDMAFLDFSF